MPSVPLYFIAREMWRLSIHILIRQVTIVSHTESPGQKINLSLSPFFSLFPKKERSRHPLERDGRDER